MGALRDRDVPKDGAGIETWVAAGEAVFPDIVPGTEKRIVWADPAAKARTAVALVYLHGFSASRQEIAPVPQLAAAALGANLFLTRLAGHGRGSAAMGEASAGDWMDDLGESVAIGRRLGERGVLIGTSTGGTLAVLAAFDPELRRDLAGLVLLSPNFGVNSLAAPLLTMPFARRIVPMVMRKDVGFEPVNAANARYWTTRYPATALLPMGELVKAAVALPFAQASVPALFVLNDADKVVDPAKTRRIARLWGAPHEMLVLAPGPGDDAYAHVLAGDILSPGGTAAVVSKIVEWIGGLE